MSTDAPDLAGLRDAQERKRAAMGETVRFLWAETRTYPAGTALNAEGEPLDPTVAPSSVTQPSVEVTAAVAQGTGTIQRLARESQSSAAGRFERGEVLVICDLADEATVEGAEEFIRLSTGERFRVVADRVDGVAIPDRFLVYGVIEG